VTKICIDDFALKKLHTYGTVMIDIESRRIIDMIPSRDAEEVKAWLEAFPNITVVSRDGSNTYRNAISEALPGAVQVSDRFHLLKNLVDYSKEYLKKELCANVKIAAAHTMKTEVLPPLSKADGNRKLTRKEKYERLKSLIGLGYGKTAICRELSIDFRTYERFASADSDELEKQLTRKSVKRHEENLLRKQALIEEVRELKIHGFSNLEISRRTGLDHRTVGRYISPKFNPVNAHYGVKKSNGTLSPFVNEINHMLSKGLKGTVIESVIREKGYRGSPSNIRYYIADWKNNRKHDYDNSRPDAAAFETIERKNLYKLLYHPLSKVKEITEAQFEAVAAKYPAFERIHNIVWEFKEILTGKNENALMPWISKAGTLNIAEINSFIAGIKHDIGAVTNAVALPYSNGMAEGNINKIKVIKRIMYGRCGFELLKSKILQLELDKVVT